MTSSMPTLHQIRMVFFATLVAVSLGIAEYWRHRKKLAKIPVRIHVNGTRGKSSVTRLIAAGLRAGGLVTCAKTTGTLPRMIMPDGREYPVFRPGRTNIIEQLRIVSAAVDVRAQVLVIECMALQPFLQWLSESKMIRATHGVITNARADHLDIMGPTVEDVAKALCGMVPSKGKLYTAEQYVIKDMQNAAIDRGSELIKIKPDEIFSVSQKELAGFSYIEHAENVALALKICADLGVDRKTALAGMWRAQPDPGVMKDYRLDFFGRDIVFVNGFAANDPDSTKMVWQIAINKYPDFSRRVAIFNCRADRADRSLQLGKDCVNWIQADAILLMGTGTYAFAKAAIEAGLDGRKFHFVDDVGVEAIFEAVVGISGAKAIVVGMGNIGDHGLELTDYFRNRSIMQAS